MVGDEPYESPEAHSVVQGQDNLLFLRILILIILYLFFVTTFEFRAFSETGKKFYPIWQREIKYELERRAAENNREV